MDRDETAALDSSARTLLAEVALGKYCLPQVNSRLVLFPPDSDLAIFKRSFFEALREYATDLDFSCASDLVG